MRRDEQQRVHVCTSVFEGASGGWTGVRVVPLGWMDGVVTVCKHQTGNTENKQYGFKRTGGVGLLVVGYWEEGGLQVTSSIKDIWIDTLSPITR